MNALRAMIMMVITFGGALCWTAASAGTAEPAAPSIQGSYVLDYRELPDGRQVRPPEIIGMITFTKDHRNFNIYWTENGRPLSISTISKYSLTGTEYNEESLYYFDNGAGGKGPTYQTRPARGQSSVTMNGDKVKFKLPLHGEPSVVFDKNGFTATRAGAFVDHWKKID